MTVFFSIPMGASISAKAANSLFAVCLRAGERGYNRISCEQGRTDQNRNQIVNTFLEYSGDDNDTLIMLDADHIYPNSIVHDLADRHIIGVKKVGVVGALAYKRGDNHQPLFFYKQEDGSWATPIEWPKFQTFPCDFVSTSAISIKRWVFTELEQAGFKAPFFRYTYDGDGPNYPAEDSYFAEICIEAGIRHYVDTSLVIPHITYRTIDHKDWEVWYQKNQDKLGVLDEKILPDSE